MKPLSDLDHYEVLEIAPDASPEEVERAYHVARSAYAEGSLATYSVFGERDTEALRHRIEFAWRTLGDPQARRAYDLGRSGGALAAEAAPDESDPILEAVARRLESQETPARPLPYTAAPAAQASGPLPLREADPEEVDGDCDGERLRRARIKQGLELAQLAAITKINPMHLRSIESDAIDQLPAPVYIRGFVKAYARCVGLDPAAAASSYMARFEAVQPKRRGRLLGRQPQA